MTHSGTGTRAKGGCCNLLPLHQTVNQTGICSWDHLGAGEEGPGGSEGARRATAEPAQGGERSSRCPRPGHADFCCFCSPSGVGFLLAKSISPYKHEILSFLAQQRFPISSNISFCLPSVKKGRLFSFLYPESAEHPSLRDTPLRRPLQIDLNRRHKEK